MQEIRLMPRGRFVRCVGLLIRPHRPPTRSGKIVVFFSLLDETGVLEARMSPDGYQKFGGILFGVKNSVIVVGGQIGQNSLDVKAVSRWDGSVPPVSEHGNVPDVKTN
jgi:error-prone DNA polymerase